MNYKITLVKSLNGRLKKQIATAHALGLRRIGDTTTQPDNDCTRGKIAKKRGQTLAQMALAWDLRDSLTSVIIGASKPSQITENAAAVKKLDFSADELKEIDAVLAQYNRE